MKPKVFVSAGTPGDERQAEFKVRVIASVKQAGLEPKILDDGDWDYKNPMRGLRRAFRGCSGTIVIAYTRYEFPNGVEKRKGNTTALDKTLLPTAWNQIEAAMAYERGLPLLVVAEEGIRPDAIFEKSGDIRPFWTALDPEICSSDGFLGYINSWKEDVEEVHQSRLNDKEEVNREVSLGQLFKALPWYEGLAVTTTIVGFIIAALTVGYKFGAGEWPF